MAACSGQDIRRFLGRCSGVLYRLPDMTWRGNSESSSGASSRSSRRTISLDGSRSTDQGPIRAITFVMNRNAKTTLVELATSIESHHQAGLLFRTSPAGLP